MSGNEDRNEAVASFLKTVARQHIDDSVPTVADAAPPGAPVEEEGAQAEAERAGGDNGAAKPNVKKSREWETRPENKPYHYRVGQDVHQLVLNAVAEYEAEGWLTTTSQVARVWLLAGWQAWQRGEVEVEGKPLESGKRRRKT